MRWINDKFKHSAHNKESKYLQLKKENQGFERTVCKIAIWSDQNKI